MFPKATDILLLSLLGLIVGSNAAPVLNAGIEVERVRTTYLLWKHYPTITLNIYY
jgi:hypothetical protein